MSLVWFAGSLERKALVPREDRRNLLNSSMRLEKNAVVDLNGMRVHLLERQNSQVIQLIGIRVCRLLLKQLYPVTLQGITYKGSGDYELGRQPATKLDCCSYHTRKRRVEEVALVVIESGRNLETEPTGTVLDFPRQETPRQKGLSMGAAVVPQQTLKLRCTGNGMQWRFSLIVKCSEQTGWQFDCTAGVTCNLGLRRLGRIFV